MSLRRFLSRLLVGLTLPLSLLATAAQSQVLTQQKISQTQGGFTGELGNAEYFGRSVEPLGDVDGDGVGDLAVGVIFDDDGGSDRGCVWVLFMNRNGTVRANQKISDTEGGFTGVLDHDDRFGFSVAALGDVDGDGVVDLVATATTDDDGGTDRGAVWILFLNADGTVNRHQKISDTQGNFFGQLDDGDLFGRWAASIGDLDGDGVVDLAVGASDDDDGGTDRGAVWILFLNPDGTVKNHQKISGTQGGFTGQLDDGDRFGLGVASLEADLDGDGTHEIISGAQNDDDGGTNRGAVWILFLNQDGTVRQHQKISNTEGGFTGILQDGDFFGIDATSVGDLDCDGVPEIAVGARHDGDGGANRGAIWVLYLNPDATVKGHFKISDTQGGFGGDLDNNDVLGVSVASPGDLNGDGVVDLIAGAQGDDDGGHNRGAIWTIFLGPELAQRTGFDTLSGGATIPPGTPIDDEFSGASALFSARSDSGNFLPPITNVPSPPSSDDIVPTSLRNVIQTQSAPGQMDSDSGVIFVDFVDPVSGEPRAADAVSVYFLDIEDSGFTSPIGPGRGSSALIALDALGAEVARVEIPVGPNGGRFRAVIGFPGSGLSITRVLCDVGDSLDSGAIDDLCYHFPDPPPVAEIGCRAGAVNVGFGGLPVDVLFVNGSSGVDEMREVTVAPGDSVSVFLRKPPGAPGQTLYGIFGFPGEPSSGTVLPLPKNLGAICMNPLVSVGLPCGVCPVFVANTIGRPERIGSSTAEATGNQVPGIVLNIPPLAAGTTFYFQGFVGDLQTRARVPFSVTNGVVVRVD